MDRRPWVGTVCCHNHKHSVRRLLFPRYPNCTFRSYAQPRHPKTEHTKDSPCIVTPVSDLPYPVSTVNRVISSSTYKFTIYHSPPIPYSIALSPASSNMQVPFTTVDVFSSTPYTGNPLAIVRVPSTLRTILTEQQKQKIAREFNLSETVFLHEPTEHGTADFDIFTPLARMSFAGHPTIGTAVYVSQHPEAYAGVERLRALAGLVPFTYDAGEKRVKARVPHDFRVHEKRLAHPFPGKDTNASASVTVPLVSIVKGMAFNLVPMAGLEALGLPTKGLLPVEECYLAEHLDRGSGWDVGYTGTFYYVDLGVDPKDEGVRVLRTRSIGTREDPGTGSASCALCCYLAVEARKEGGPREQRFHITQGVEVGRKCDIFITVKMSEDGESVESVELCGTAARVMEGILTIE